MLAGRVTVTGLTPGRAGTCCGGGAEVREDRGGGGGGGTEVLLRSTLAVVSAPFMQS